MVAAVPMEQLAIVGMFNNGSSEIRIVIASDGACTLRRDGVPRSETHRPGPVHDRPRVKSAGEGKMPVLR